MNLRRTRCDITEMLTERRSARMSVRRRLRSLDEAETPSPREVPIHIQEPEMEAIRHIGSPQLVFNPEIVDGVPVRQSAFGRIREWLRRPRQTKSKADQGPSYLDDVGGL